MKTPLLWLFVSSFAPIFASGCAATALNPGADRVLVTHAPAPQDCRFAGTVIGDQGGSLTGPFTSNHNLAEGAVNDMKNKAHDMGANYVVLETTTAGNTISGNGRHISGGQTDVTHMGNAFVCPNVPEASPDGQASR
jgi:hypothetical protein